MEEKKLTDEEIVKALECCINSEGCDCGNCSYNNNDDCQHRSGEDLLDLIHRLQDEIERLTEKASYRKIPEGAVVLTEKEYKRYERIEKIIKLAKMEKAIGYEVKNGKLYYFTNMLEGFEYEFKDLQEICDTANHYNEEFFGLQQRLDFWKGKAEETRKETAEKFAERLKAKYAEIAKSYEDSYNEVLGSDLPERCLFDVIEGYGYVDCIDEICKEIKE